MWALSLPVLVHWAMNSVRDRLAIERVTHSDSGTVTTVSSVSSGEIVSIITSTATTVSTELNNWVTDIASDCWRLSTSFVTRLSTSPRCRESKYRSGSRCTLSSTSARSATIVRCTTVLSSRACSQTNSAATRYSPIASASVRPTAPKSTPCPGTTFMPDSRSAKLSSPLALADSTA